MRINEDFEVEHEKKQSISCADETKEKSLQCEHNKHSTPNRNECCESQETK